MIQHTKPQPPQRRLANWPSQLSWRLLPTSLRWKLQCSFAVPLVRLSPRFTSALRCGQVRGLCQQKGAAGFTLVELILATAFIAFILIFMLATMLSVMSNYNKGLAVKQINQTARTVTDEMSRLIQSTDASVINTSRIANGRVCFGGVSYVWNIRNNTSNRYTTGVPVKMARVNDAGGALCGATLPNVNPANASEQLSSQIWVQQMNVVVSSNQRLVDITISLSTASPNHPTGTDPVLGAICDGSKDSQYCAIATFRTTVATKSGGG